MNITDYGRSLIRTFVPVAVGAIGGWLATRNINVDTTAWIPAIDAAVASVYYGIIRALEQKYPKAGWLLGYASTPSYSPAKPAVVAPPVEAEAGPAMTDEEKAAVSSITNPFA